MNAFRIGQHVRLIGTEKTGRVMGLTSYQGQQMLRVARDGTRWDQMTYPVGMWEVIE